MRVTAPDRQGGGGRNRQSPDCDVARTSVIIGHGFPASICQASHSHPSLGLFRSVCKGAMCKNRQCFAHFPLKKAKEYPVDDNRLYHSTIFQKIQAFFQMAFFGFRLPAPQRPPVSGSFRPHLIPHRKNRGISFHQRDSSDYLIPSLSLPHQ